MRDVVATGLQVAGIAAIVVAAFVAFPLLGVAVAGGVAVLVGVGLES